MFSETVQAVAAGISALLVLAFAFFSAAHALLNKRDTRAVIAWVGLIMLLPLGGSILYWLLGVNRIKRKARALREAAGGDTLPLTVEPGQVDPRWRRMACVGDALGLFSICAGNRIHALINGDEAYPEMLAAIESAESSVSLATYIFDHDHAGLRFLQALERARNRGVEVRVLIDGVGARYSRRSMVRRLRKAGVPTRLFLPMHLPRSLASFNLRNHRKLLIVDGRAGFTGGMNIRAGNLLEYPSRHPIQDLQFKVSGPVVAQMQHIFAADWHFASGEHLMGDRWFPPLKPDGPALARGIPDGPDEDFENLRMIIQAAIAEAEQRIVVVTPYFLPDDALLTALNSAALRGIRVEILLPRRGNLRLVQWASQSIYRQLLERGCRIRLSPPPFDHSKLMLVDGEWILLGSANWDPRSLRLNFEYNLECLDRELGTRLEAWVDRRWALSREVTLDEVDAQPLPAQLRDGAARLLTPYL